MPEMHLKEPGFSGPFTKSKERIEKFMQTGNTNFFIKINLIKLVSTWYGLWQIKNLVKRTQSDKVLRNKPFKIASDPEYDGYQRELASMVYKFFDKKIRFA